MKKSILFILCMVLSVWMLNAQEYYLHTHRNGNITFEKKISEIDSIWFLNNSAVFTHNSGLQTIQFVNIDSVTFSADSTVPTYDIYIVYNGNSVTVTNPLASTGVTITDSMAHVNVVTTAGISDITYHVSGTTTDGCLNITFGITGGTIIGTAPSGMYSNPTASACTQHLLKYTHASNNAVQLIRNSDNEVILTFHVPTISGGGGWPGGGGSSSAIMTFSSPEFVQGTYTLKHGGTISGGTGWHNYYTGATYTGGSSKTVTVSSAITVSVN